MAAEVYILFTDQIISTSDPSNRLIRDHSLSSSIMLPSTATLLIFMYIITNSNPDISSKEYSLPAFHHPFSPHTPRQKTTNLQICKSTNVWTRSQTSSSYTRQPPDLSTAAMCLKRVQLTCSVTGCHRLLCPLDKIDKFDAVTHEARKTAGRNCSPGVLVTTVATMGTAKGRMGELCTDCKAAGRQGEYCSNIGGLRSW